MARLTDKDALVAEIERLREVQPLDEFQPKEQNKIDWLAGKLFTINSLDSFIDTLEVKEVDLEGLVKDFCYEYDNRKEIWYELCPNDRKLLHNPTWANFAMSIAKHFFELGVKAKQG